jgi:antitoxin YefM
MSDDLKGDVKRLTNFTPEYPLRIRDYRVLFEIDILEQSMYSISVHKKEANMAIQTTYTNARARLASLIDEVIKNREIVIIQRRGNEDVAMIAADELSGILETAHLLRSPANAERLNCALERVREQEGSAQTIDELRREVGLD